MKRASWSRNRALFAFVVLLVLIRNVPSTLAALPQAETPSAPAVTKVEPPNWWLRITPEVVVLLSGHKLEATRVSCNLPTVHVSRTQSSASGDYLFVWLKIEDDTKSGTLVCRIVTPTGATSFELPLAARAASVGKFQGLSQEDVIYLIMPDRFANGDPAKGQEADAKDQRSNPRAYHGGDLRGIQDHLPYLKELGVTTLWLTPVVKNGAAQDYHGYGAVDLYAVEPHLGTLNEYQNLVAAAHQQGMKIFFDMVPNHVGTKHPWVANPPLPDWFHGTLQHHLDSLSPQKNSFYGKPDGLKSANDTFESLVDPHMPVRFRQNLTEGWFFGMLPDMNTENPMVAQYLLQNAIWWAEVSGLDGYRVDTFPYVSRQFWATWHAGLRKIYPNLTTIGEVFHPDPSVTSFFVGGQKHEGIDTGLSTVFDFPLFFTLRDVLVGGAPAGRIADVLRHDALYPRPDRLVAFFANHDVPRFASLAGSTPEKEKLAFALTLTIRGIPQLYYGDEIGMPGGEDPDNRHDFPGGWRGDAHDAFTRAGRNPEQQDIFNYVLTLLRLRREHVALQSGNLWHLFSDDMSYVFLRKTEEESLLIAFNNSAQTREVRVPFAATPAQGVAGISLILGEAKAALNTDELRINMPPQSLTIFNLN